MTNEELIKKWKTVLDYTDDNTPPLGEWDALYRATLMENCEIYYLHHNDPPMDTHTPKVLLEMICEIRRSCKLSNPPYE